MAGERSEAEALSAAATRPAVSVSGVTRRFGAVQVLRGVDLEIAAGCVAAIFGSNGAGKTTLLRMLAGLVRPTRGTIRLFEKHAPGSAGIRGRVGVVAHDTFLYGDLNARENLAYYAGLYGADARAVDSLLTRVGLQDAASRPVRTYSRGMQQRLALARSIVHQPELLLLDEPFTGLDPKARDIAVDILTQAAAAGTTIVFTTHDFEMARAIAGRGVLLHRGRVAWQHDGGLPPADEMTDVYRRTTEA